MEILSVVLDIASIVASIVLIVVIVKGWGKENGKKKN